MEWKNDRNDGGMHGDKWGRWICLRKCSFWILLFLLDCLWCPPTNNNYIFFYLFFFLKQLGFLTKVFTQAICCGHLKGVFHPGIFLFFFSIFFIIELPHDVFYLKMGLRLLVEVFIWVLIFLLFYFFSVTRWGKSWKFLHHLHCFIDISNELLFWWGSLKHFQSVPIKKQWNGFFVYSYYLHWTIIMESFNNIRSEPSFP